MHLPIIMQPLKLALNFCIIIIVGWSEELAVDAWTNDRESACEKAGIATEEESLGSTSIVVHKVSRERRKRGRERERRDDVVIFLQCGICDEEIPSWTRIKVPCEHNFCQTCWKM